jgi:NTP pyrophosphatase (non-canonical NTP hydrolase)
MEINKYQELALRTAKPLDSDLDDLQHALLGMTSEVGEIADAFKKHVIYGKPLDKANIAEEIGDVLWYLAIGAKAIGVSLDEIAAGNITKLQARYPEKYSDELAAARLDKEPQQ